MTITDHTQPPHRRHRDQPAGIGIDPPPSTSAFRPSPIHPARPATRSSQGLDTGHRQATPTDTPETTREQVSIRVATRPYRLSPVTGAERHTSGFESLTATGLTMVGRPNHRGP
jgi:hypothetical protein